jgi:hypothetical protein
MSVADAQVVASNFLVSIFENLNPNDIPTVTAAFQAAISENVTLADNFGVGGWIKIVTTQIPGWTNITDTQTPGWTGMDNNQTPGWVNINTE